MRRMTKYQRTQEQEHKNKGITIGVPIPKRIPLKVAPIRDTFYLERGNPKDSFNPVGTQLKGLLRLPK